MKIKDKKVLKKEIKSILEESNWRSDYSTYFELTDFILTEIEKLEL